jgi:hypothetical protein
MLCSGGFVFSRNKDKSLEFEKLKWDYQRLWDYFHLHAEQRIKTFHLFLIMSGLISSGLAIILSKAGIHTNKIASSCYCKKAATAASESPTSVAPQQAEVEQYNACVNALPDLMVIMLILGFLLMIFSVIFWWLENRNHRLVSICRSQLCELESKEKISYPIFSFVEHDATINSQQKFRKCFILTFRIIFNLGLIIVIYALYRLAFISWFFSCLFVI